MAISCTKHECTVATTGKCLLLIEPRDSCDNFIADEAAQPLVQDVKASPVDTTTPDIARTFFAGFELGTSDAAEIMQGDYGTLVAVLGPYDVGKTCFLSSLYLMTAARKIGTDLAFAGSLTLNGFEARARRLREWKDGALPQEFVVFCVITQLSAVPIFVWVGRHCEVQAST